MPNTIKGVEIDPVREKLVELLGGDMCKDCYCEDCEHENNEKACIKHIKERMADHLIRNGVTVQQWISVKDRLPEIGENVLAYMQNSVVSRVFPAVYCKQRRKFMWWDNVFGVEVLSVTHWMPLPQPPKE